MLVQSRRDSRAALRLMRKLLRKHEFVPKLLVTDKLRSYGSAFRQLQLTCPHEQGLSLAARDRIGVNTSRGRRIPRSAPAGRG
jgi:transposase-like protein